MINDRGVMICRWRFFAALSVVLGLLFAETIAAADDAFKVETVLEDLHLPTGIAVRPTTNTDGYEIYVADAGAGRVVGVASGKPDAAEDVITGFVSSSDVAEPLKSSGPHGLLFLDPTRLVVTGSEGDNRPFVRLYELTNEEKALSAEQHEQVAAPAADDETLDDDVTSFHGLARTQANDQVSDFLVLTATTNDGGVSVWRLPVRSGTLGDLKLLGKDQPSAAPVAVAVEPRGYIVLSRPEVEDSATSRLAFVNPINGQAVIEVPVKLQGVIGLAYSPRSGNLYALGSPPRNSRRGGVYRLDADETADTTRPTANAARIADIERPTSLAFGSDGVLYVTALDEQGSNGKTRGLLLKISGDL